jgi:hypothetical protein
MQQDRAVDIGALQHRTSRYSLSGQLRALVVNAHVGSVHITGSGSGKVSVTERISFRQRPDHRQVVFADRANGRLYDTRWEAASARGSGQGPASDACSLSGAPKLLIAVRTGRKTRRPATKAHDAAGPAGPR